MRHVWFIYLLLALCTLAVYWPTFSYDFIDYDDPQQVFIRLRMSSLTDEQMVSISGIARGAEYQYEHIIEETLH